MSWKTPLNRSDCSSVRRATIPHGWRGTSKKSVPRKPCALKFSTSNLTKVLAQSHARGFDEDPFDAVCDHLIVEHLPSQQIVGTYRLQTGAKAEKNLGYYCAAEFEFDVF